MPKTTVTRGQIAAQVPIGLKQAVQDRADAEGLSPSDILRRAVMAYLGVDVNGNVAARRRRKDGRQDWQDTCPHTPLCHNYPWCMAHRDGADRD